MKRSLVKALTLALLPLVSLCSSTASLAQEDPARVRVEQVRLQPLQRTLPLSGRVHSRNDASMALTLSGELDWVLEPGIRVLAGDVIAKLDQRPILLRKAELEHMAQRARINTAYTEKELKRLHRLRKDNNASERQLDETESARDVAIQDERSLQSRIDQLDDELRRSQLIAPYAGVIANREKRGGEYAQPGDVIIRLVDLANLELRFHVPVVYLPRIRVGQQVSFSAQGGQLLGRDSIFYKAQVRTIIPAANVNSQAFEIRADIDEAASKAIVAGQLTHVELQLASGESTLQVPRDAIVLRAEGKYVFRIDADNTAHKVMVSVGEGAADWVSINGGVTSDASDDLTAGDWVAVRGIERLQDGQHVNREGS